MSKDAYAYDFSVVPGPEPTVIIKNNGKGMLGYSFASRQTDEYLDAMREAGLKVAWIWERDTDSIFHLDGAAECRAHERRAKPGELTYVACDTRTLGDTTPFLKSWSDATREDVFGIYGPDFAIAQAQGLQSNKCQRWWGVVNWINGGKPDNHPDNITYWRNAQAHLVQLIGSPIPDTDQNLILRDEWADVFATPRPPIPPLPGEDNMVRIDLGGSPHWIYVMGKNLYTRAFLDGAYTPPRQLNTGFSMGSDALNAWNTGIYGWNVQGVADDGATVEITCPSIAGWVARKV